jgi:hypothetical protein
MSSVLDWALVLITGAMMECDVDRHKGCRGLSNFGADLSAIECYEMDVVVL